MKATILGYWGGFPSAGGATVGNLISTGEGEILLDCGSGVASRMFFYTSIESISGIIISHLHYDHMGDLGVLGYATANALRNNRTDGKMKVYAPGEPKDMWQSIHSVNFDVYNMADTGNLRIAGADISFMPVRHTIPCYAVRIEHSGKVLAFVTDTVYFDELADFAEEADLLICGAAICPGSTHTTGLGHMDARGAGTLARKAKVKELVLTHLPHDGDFNLMKAEAEESFGRAVRLPILQSTYIL